MFRSLAGGEAAMNSSIPQGAAGAGGSAAGRSIL